MSGCWFGIVVIALVTSAKLLSRVCTWMGNHFNSAHHPFVGWQNEYQLSKGCNPLDRLAMNLLTN